MSEKAICGNCSSENVFGMSRVVGYYSIIENWNDSKKAELVDRQKGKYKIDEKAVLANNPNINLQKEKAVAVVR